MTLISSKALFAACLGLAAFAAQAQTLPADAPAGTTVQCKDDSYASPDAKSGACRGHKGIKTWFGGKADAKPAAPTAAATPAPAAAAAAAPAVAAAAAPSKKADKTASMTAAPGGGTGKVWLNDKSNVYHCMGDPSYGKTKKGEYVSEADAKAKGGHASHGKACS